MREHLITDALPLYLELQWFWYWILLHLTLRVPWFPRHQHLQRADDHFSTMYITRLEQFERMDLGLGKVRIVLCRAVFHQGNIRISRILSYNKWKEYISSTDQSFSNTFYLDWWTAIMNAKYHERIQRKWKIITVLHCHDIPIFFDFLFVHWVFFPQRRRIWWSSEDKPIAFSN